MWEGFLLVLVLASRLLRGIPNVYFRGKPDCQVRPGSRLKLSPTVRPVWIEVALQFCRVFEKPLSNPVPHSAVSDRGYRAGVPHSLIKFIYFNNRAQRIEWGRIKCFCWVQFIINLLVEAVLNGVDLFSFLAEEDT